MQQDLGGNINLSLDRIYKILDAMHDPFKDYKIIHVAGTNGKGSVCAFMASILISSGYKTGQFNSPHFIDPSDSILINGKVSSYFNEIYSKVTSLSESKNVHCTPFEIMTATAFMIFKLEKIDIALVEVGLGGRLDATNIINPPKIAIITSMSLDHVEYLGDTIEDITREKCGIIKNGTNAVIVSNQEFNQVYDIVESYTSKYENCQIYKVDLESVVVKTETDHNWIVVNYFQESMCLPVKLHGIHQINNAFTALLALSRLEAIDSDFCFTYDNIKTGMESVCWRGRLDKLQYKNRTFIVDGAHNLSGAQNLKKYLKSKNQESVVWIMGFTKNKDIDGILRCLLEKGDTLIATPFESPINMPWVKCVPTRDIINAALHITENIQCFESSGIQNSIQLIDQRPDSPVVICGSLYLVSQFYALE